MATVGRHKAVAEIGGRHFDGFIAWLLWSVVHVVSLVSFRARVFVLLNWVWTYVFFSKGARLITGDSGERSRRVDGQIAQRLRLIGDREHQRGDGRDVGGEVVGGDLVEGVGRLWW